MDYFEIPAQYVVVRTEKEREYSHLQLSFLDYPNTRRSGEDWSTVVANLYVNFVVCRHSVPRVRIEGEELSYQFGWARVGSRCQMVS